MFGVVVDELNRLWIQQKLVPGLMGNPKFRCVWDYILHYANEELLEQPIGSTMRIGNALVTHIPRSLSINITDPTENGFLQVSQASQLLCQTDGSTAWRNKTFGAVHFGGQRLDYPPPPRYQAFRAYVEWSTSLIPANLSIVKNMSFKYQGFSINATDEEINPISGQPSIATDAGLYADIASGTAYVDPFNIESGTYREVDLGSSAVTDLQAAIDGGRSWFALGFQSPGNECPAAIEAYDLSNFYSKGLHGPGTPPPTLYLEYEVPGPPTPPGSTLTATQTVSSGSRHIETPYTPYSIVLRTRTILRHITRTLRG